MHIDLGWSLVHVGGRIAGGVDDRGSGGGRPRGSCGGRRRWRRRRWRRRHGGAGRTACGHRRTVAAKMKGYARRSRRNCSVQHGAWAHTNGGGEDKGLCSTKTKELFKSRTPVHLYRGGTFSTGP